MTEVARVLDRDALDACEGPRVRIRIAVPRAWATELSTILVEAPERVPCAGCDGGGCDACGRSGVFRLGASPAERTFSVSLPVQLGNGAVLRIARPFGEESPIVLALCEVRPSSEASGCTRVPAPPAELANVAAPLALVPGRFLPVAAVGTLVAALAMLVTWWLGAH